MNGIKGEMGSKSRGEDVKRLRKNVDWALRESLGADELIPMLRKLLRAVPQDGDDALFAHRHLAELLVEEEPWAAALSAKRILTRDPDDERAWAVLGLSFTLLSHYRAAVSAYRKALAIAPANPWYAHNLGHLLDVALARPIDGLPLLAAAHRKEPSEVEIASSYAHALGRTGRSREGWTLLQPYLKDGGSDEQRALLRWLERDASGRRGKGKTPRRKARSPESAATRNHESGN